MDDLVLVATLDDSSKLYVTLLHPRTYSEHVESDVLGGGDGYFLVRETSSTFEILAKAPSFEAAGTIFDLITAQRRPTPQYEPSSKVY
jgi:hypothetical protein